MFKCCFKSIEFLKMNRIFFSFVFTLIFSFPVFSQDEQTLITIDNTKISKAEFERIYRKNNSNLYNDSDIKTPQEYLDLFINFKLKVIEAENLKMDTAAAFINELKGYRKELAAPYLTDVQFKEQMVKELYDRSTKEINASHILLTVDKNATEEQDHEVLEKIKKIRQEIIDGEDFGDAAVKYSQDPSAKTNKGNLGYFTAFQMVAPFENAAYNTPVGEISQPVRTSFGYHLIKVNDIRPNKGEIQVAHIMKMFPRNMTPQIKAKLKAEIDSIYQELQNGADFAELAKANSDDKRSAMQGGVMPWFNEGRMIPEFAEPAFNLKKDGDYTAPIETPYGYHIIRRIELRPVPSFEESKKNIENRIKNDPQRSITNKTAFVNKLKKEYGFSENNEGLKKLKSMTIADGLNENNFELFTIDEKKYGLNDFNKYLQEKKITEGDYMTNYDNWVVDEITRLEDSKLEEKYPEFRYMMQEYHDGILLFNISEEKIWNYAAQDSVGLQEFYEKNKKNHLWGERFKGYVVTCKDAETRDKADAYFGENMPIDEIKDRLNKDDNRITIEEGKWEKGANPVVDYYIWNQPEPENFNSELYFVRGDMIPPEPKTLEEARGLYVSDYQKVLEDNWIKELRKKHKIKVNKKLLKTIKGV